jgi:predicted metal-binding protein
MILFKDRGFPDFKWIEAKDIVVAQWVRFRCMFGCPVYGKRGTCPPNVPSIDECRKMISEYNHVAVFHFEKKLEKPAVYATARSIGYPIQVLKNYDEAMNRYAFLLIE